MEKSADYLKNPEVDKNRWKPQSAVWELTLACNLRCGHCGSRAGKALPDEMNTEECLDLVRQLDDLGCELITLSGGEPTLREDWDIIAKEIHRRKIYVNMVTNGIYTKGVQAADIAKRALAAGMCNAGVSLDGPKEIHDQIRGKGTFDKTSASIRTFIENGLSTTVMTTVNKLNLHHLWKMRDVAIDLGVPALRFQLAKPMGTMDDHRDWVLDPEQIGTLMPELARMKQAGGVDIRLGDSLGYYGKPDKVLRSWNWRNKRSRWGGCQAGMKAIGIQANGDIKGCLSMQAARGDEDPFVEGNVRKTSLEQIWYRKGAFVYNREFSLDSLTHDCKECKQAARCRGGARCISSATDGTTTHDDYCYYRLCGADEEMDLMRAGKSAAAAAALVLMVNTTGCAEDGDNPESDAGADAAVSATDTDETSSATSKDSDTSMNALDYAVEPMATDTYEFVDVDYGVEPMPEYGIEPVPVYGVEPIPMDTNTGDDEPVLEYGIEPEPDYAVTPDYAVMPDYAVEPMPIDTDRTVKPLRDTDSDMAVLEYGVMPDYGVEPPEK